VGKDSLKKDAAAMAVIANITWYLCEFMLSVILSRGFASYLFLLHIT
jgi:hypothetical protein